MKYKKALFYALIAALVGLGSYQLIKANSKVDGKVMGATINSVYSEKLITTHKPPQRKSGADDPKIYAQSAILIDEATKYPLYAKGADTPVPIASITKVMTALVSLDTYKLNEIIEVKQESTEVEGSKIELVAGEKIKIENLLYGLLMNSGNDAAKALASGRGSEEDFVAAMNKKADELGLRNTKLYDAAGLNDQGRSSAFDVALLFAYAIKDETFVKIINTAEKEVSSEDALVRHQLKSSNRLVNGEMPFEGVVGGKTGYTPDAGHTLVCAASKNGHTLVSVVLKTDYNTKEASAEETKKLLAWGFDSFNF